MKLKLSVAKMMMGAMAYTLCRTVCHTEEFDTLTSKEKTEYVNNTVRKLFVDYCDELKIDEVENDEV